MLPRRLIPFVIGRAISLAGGLALTLITAYYCTPEECSRIFVAMAICTIGAIIARRGEPLLSARSIAGSSHKQAHETTISALSRCAIGSLYLIPLISFTSVILIQSNFTETTLVVFAVALLSLQAPLFALLASRKSGFVMNCLDPGFAYAIASTLVVISDFFSINHSLETLTAILIFANLVSLLIGITQTNIDMRSLLRTQGLWRITKEELELTSSALAATFLQTGVFIVSAPFLTASDIVTIRILERTNATIPAIIVSLNIYHYANAIKNLKEIGPNTLSFAGRYFLMTTTVATVLAILIVLISPTLLRFSAIQENIDFFIRFGLVIASASTALSGCLNFMSAAGGNSSTAAWTNGIVFVLGMPLCYSLAWMFGVTGYVSGAVACSCAALCLNLFYARVHFTRYSK